MFTLFLNAAWQVALAAVLLGAGLPALFALGVRSFAVADGETGTGQTGATHPAFRVVGILCFVLVVAAVLLALAVIIATGFGQSVSFESGFPTFVEKK